MHMRRIRYGMIGGGQGSFIGAVHRAAMRLDDGWDFVCGALSSTPEKSKASAKEVGLADDRAYGSWAEMIEAEASRDPADRMEAVVIVTPNHAHAAPAEAALRAGFHVVCDKPLCTSLEEADALVNAQAETGRVFAVTYNYSGYPMVKQARRMVADGAIGTVRKIIVEYNQGWLATKLEDSGQKQAAWRTDTSVPNAGGAIGDIGSHAEQLTRYITRLEPRSMLADLSSLVPGRTIDDDANIILQLKEVGSPAGPMRAKCVLIASQVATGRLNDLRIRIFGTRGGLEWRQETPNTLRVDAVDGPTQIFHRGDGGLCAEAQAATRIPTGHPEGFYEAFANIYRGVRMAILQPETGETPTIDHPSLDDGVRGVRFIRTAIDHGVSSGAWTPIG
jgi:predicted dehydrogenase